MNKQADSLCCIFSQFKFLQKQVETWEHELNTSTSWRTFGKFVAKHFAKN